MILQGAIRDSLIETLEDTSASVPSTFLSRHPSFPAKQKTSSSRNETSRLKNENARLRRKMKIKSSQSRSMSALERDIEIHIMSGWPPETIMDDFIKQGFSPTQIRRIIDKLRYRLE